MPPKEFQPRKPPVPSRADRLASAPSPDAPRPRPGRRHQSSANLPAIAASSKPAAQRSRSPVYWQAMHPTQLFAGPLGDVVGEVDEGTVVIEHHRYEDPFGGWWMSTHTAENSGLVWISYNDSQYFPIREQPNDSLWQRVYDSRATPEEKLPVRRRGSQILVQANKAEYNPYDAIPVSCLRSYLHGDKLSPSDISLIDYYWNEMSNSVPLHSTEEVAAHWNQRYQECVEKVLFPLEGHTVGDGEEKLERCLDEFKMYAEEIALIFVEDLTRTASDRRITPHASHKNIFYYGNVCVKICCDNAEGSFGGDYNAQKIATRHFQSSNYVAQQGPTCFLYPLLTCAVVFEGHKLLIFAIPPISSSSCMYAPLRHGESLDTPDVVKQLTSKLAEQLRCAEHAVIEDSGSSFQSLPCHLPVDMEVYAGRDRRMYLVNCGRALPSCPVLNKKAPPPSIFSSPVAVNPVPAVSEQDEKHMKFLVQAMINRFRPELVHRWPLPVNPDAYIGECSPEDQQTAMDMLDAMKDTTITKVAGMLGCLIPIDHPLQSSVECTACGSSIDDELRFVVCQSASECCRVCSNCYISRLSESLMALENDENNNNLSQHAKWNLLCDSTCFNNVVKCGSQSRGPLSLKLQPSISTLMHANGLNLRYLPFVFYRLPSRSRFAVEQYCKVEMVARAASTLLQSRLRGAATPEDARTSVEKFVLDLTQTGAQSQKFWSRELGPQIQRTFNINARFDTSTLPLSLLMERLQELSGIHFTPESAASWARQPRGKGDEEKADEGSPFIQIHSISPRVKVFSPIRVADSEALKTYLNSMLERMLLFWIGYAPKDCLEGLQPEYLRRCDEDTPEST